MKIMFICTGNICRSAMAHVMLAEKAKAREDLQVYSCGIYAENGDIPTEEAIDVLKTIYNIDLTKHRATNIRNSNILEMDIILCATQKHKIMVLSVYPELKGKVYTMKEFAGYPVNNLDIQDPWGCDYNTYKNCAKEINECINLLLNKLK